MVSKAVIPCTSDRSRINFFGVAKTIISKRKNCSMKLKIVLILSQQQFY